jgi:hypothetical protein
MAVPTNMYQKASLKGNREDLMDKIYNTSPAEVPLSTAFGRTTATTDFHEWQTDALGAASATNKMIDGDDVTLDAQVPTLRLGNHLQIFNGSVGVSRRANIVKKAGRGAEMAYLKGKKMLELKRNIEAMIVSPTQVAIAATTAVAGQSAGLGVQLVSNPLHNGAGATPAWTSGAPTVAITAGTNRAFTKTLLDTACQNIFVTRASLPRCWWCRLRTKRCSLLSLRWRKTASMSKAERTARQPSWVVLRCTCPTLAA